MSAGNYILSSEIGLGFGEPGVTSPLLRIPSCNPTRLWACLLSPSQLGLCCKDLPIYFCVYNLPKNSGEGHM